ncbi:MULTISPECIES: hypothetical protein [unclassified Acinetobacter]|uniref:hypothetical protein n=1 Tax=unclassified Acinetobacter TaxID=196816 RepID=UPI001C212898|nr:MULTISPECIES: hypothetical protein [unclassified Acinetobacter]
MDLFYLLLNQQEFSAQDLIYAEIPWTLQSQVVMVKAHPSANLILDIDHTEYQFFLKLSLLRQLLQIYSKQNVCLAETCQRLIEFADKQQNHSSP